ncbi:MAG: transporter substrate-binding domain-containing protein [Clostridia bacterium]|nr:transporter substrate-binding domain-containing protein [Clostridia bacterium]
MKKAICLILSIAMLLCTCAWGKKDDKDILTKVKEKGYIEVATEPYWAPNEFIDPTKTGDDRIIGTDIELAKYIAEKIGVELKIVPLEFSAVLTGITEGKYDMAISAIAWSPVREMAMALSDGYEFDESAGYGFLVRAEDVGKYTSIDSLKDAVVITQSGSVQESIYLQSCNNAKELKRVGSMTDAYLAVAEGKADVCITHTSSGELYCQSNPALAVQPDFLFETDAKMTATCVALPLEGSEALMEIVNTCIAELIAKDQFTEWSNYYKEYATKLGIE